jgi:hypothetical protein
MGQLKLTGNSGAILVQPNPTAQFQSQAAPFHQPGAAIHNDRSTFAGRNLSEQWFKGKHFAQRGLDGGPGRTKGGHQSTGLQFIHTLLKESQAIRRTAFLPKKIEQAVGHGPIGIKSKTQQFETRDPTITAWRTGTCPNRRRRFFALNFNWI